MTPIMMTEEYWANSHLSIVRHTGGCEVGGHRYLVVDKLGRDVWECTMEAERLGRVKAIDPGEPCDLVRVDFIPLYRKLGRGRFLEILLANKRLSDKEIKKIMKGEKE